MSGKKWRFLGCWGQGQPWHRHLLSSDVMTKNNPPIPLIQKPPKQILLINYIMSSFPHEVTEISGFVLSILTSGQLFLNLPNKLNLKTFPATSSIAASLVSQLWKTELHLPRHFSQVDLKIIMSFRKIMPFIGQKLDNIWGGEFCIFLLHELEKNIFRGNLN